MKVLLASLLIAAMAAETPLENAAEEARARALMREIRCVACENEPVSQSAAPIAGDMRIRIREMVAEGRSNGEIRDWFVSRYGDFVLFRPPVRSPADWLLWSLPFFLLTAGALAGWQIAQRRGGGDRPIEREEA